MCDTLHFYVILTLPISLKIHFQQNNSVNSCFCSALVFMVMEVLLNFGQIFCVHNKHQTDPSFTQGISQPWL